MLHFHNNNSYHEERKLIAGHKVSHEQQDSDIFVLELLSIIKYPTEYREQIRSCTQRGAN